MSSSRLRSSSTRWRTWTIGDEAALAFAQVATLVEHALERSGESALPRIMAGIRDGDSAQWVMAQAAGYDDFDAMIAGWGMAGGGSAHR